MRPCSGSSRHGFGTCKPRRSRSSCDYSPLAVSRGPRGPIDLKTHWAIAEEAAAEADRTVDRAEWRLVVPIHIAETKRQAVEDVRAGAGRFLLDYVEATTGRPRPVEGPYEKVVDQMMDLGVWVIGTPDDAVSAIEALAERSGGFGGVMVFGQEWGGYQATRRSYELLARHVMPRFQGSLAGLQASNAIARSKADATQRQRAAAVEHAQSAYDGRSAGGGEALHGS